MTTIADNTQLVTAGPQAGPPLHSTAPEADHEDPGTVPVILILEVQVPRRTWAPTADTPDGTVRLAYARWIRDRITDGAAYLITEPITGISVDPDQEWPDPPPGKHDAGPAGGPMAASAVI